ncbi:uncharacterized protein LOC119709128 isoform X6 [Motacilla alba alba]|uniref:uncharacterized protein LOC119709128 isoform X6 n=1 Tax=Motacilla alba alba TaxID=1094192 RepID=UPI0018D59BD8|nr:uncharacterized protein LOC119709128 isoform X6 [Motacilla alba alba]
MQLWAEGVEYQERQAWSTQPCPGSCCDTWQTPGILSLRCRHSQRRAEPACDRSHGTPHSADGERRGERTRRMASAPEPLWGLAGGLLSSSSWQTRLPTLRTPSHPASAQRASASVPIPTTVQGQAGWGFEQPALAEGVSPTGRGAGTG